MFWVFFSRHVIGAGRPFEHVIFIFIFFLHTIYFVIIVYYHYNPHNQSVFGEVCIALDIFCTLSMTNAGEESFH